MISLEWPQSCIDAALKEGWGIFEHEGKPVVMRDDEANLLADDTQAKMLVRTGTGLHHRMAREAILNNNPEEWRQLNNAAACVADFKPVVLSLDFNIQTALETAPPNGLGNIPNSILEKIEASFLERARIQGYGKPSSKTYKNAEGQYFIGAMTALCTIGFVAPPRWVISIMQNDNIAKEKK